MWQVLRGLSIVPLCMSRVLWRLTNVLGVPLCVCCECREVCSECRDSRVRLCVYVESAVGSAQSDAVRVESVHDVFGVWCMANGVWRMLCAVRCMAHGV